MNSILVFAAVLTVASAGLVPAAPAFLAAGPAIYPSYSVAPLKVPHPVSYAAASGLVLKPALVAPVPVFKTIYPSPVFKAVAPVAVAAPKVKFL